MLIQGTVRSRPDEQRRPVTPYYHSLLFSKTGVLSRSLLAMSKFWSQTSLFSIRQIVACPFFPRIHKIRFISTLYTLSCNHPLPSQANEDLRNQYRYLDLRRPELSDNLRKRSKVAHIVRSVLNQQGVAASITSSTLGLRHDIPSRFSRGRDAHSS